MAELPSSNGTVIAIIAETVESVTPATPAFTTLRFRGESLSESLTSETDEEIRSDRQYTDSLIVSGESSGDVQFNMSYSAQTDMFLMAILQCSPATWLTTESIYNEKTKRFFTVEKTVVDGAGVPVYFRFNGMQAGSLALNFQDGILQGSVTFMGLQGSTDTAILAGATYGPVHTAPLMNSADSITTITVTDSSDVDLEVLVTDMTLTLDNGLRGQRALGSLYNAGIASSRFKAEFSGNLYFKDKVIYDAFKANDYMKLAITLTDSTGASYAVTLNKLKTQSFEVVAGGVDQDMIVAWAAQGFGDDASPSRTITMTKTDAV